MDACQPRRRVSPSGRIHKMHNSVDVRIFRLPSKRSWVMHLYTLYIILYRIFYFTLSPFISSLLFLLSLLFTFYFCSNTIVIMRTSILFLDSFSHSYLFIYVRL